MRASPPVIAGGSASWSVGSLRGEPCAPAVPIRAPLPALLTIQSGISKLRYATLMGIKKAKTKEPDKPEVHLALKLPAGAKGVKAGKDSLEFTVSAGKAKAAAEDLRKQIGKSGWKEKEATLEEMSGSVIFYYATRV